jgi:hypothetical protein
LQFQRPYVTLCHWMCSYRLFQGLQFLHL